MLLVLKSGNKQTERGNIKLIFGHHGIGTGCILCSVWPPVRLVLSFVKNSSVKQELKLASFIHDGKITKESKGSESI